MPLCWEHLTGVATNWGGNGKTSACSSNVAAGEAWNPGILEYPDLEGTHLLHILVSRWRYLGKACGGCGNMNVECVYMEYIPQGFSPNPHSAV